MAGRILVFMAADSMEVQSNHASPPAESRLQRLARMTNFELVREMTQFVRPVKYTAAMACLLVGLAVFLEIFGVNLTRVIINTLSHLTHHAPAVGRHAGHLKSATSHLPGDLAAFHAIVWLLVLLALTTVLLAVTNLFRSLANTKLSMDMVYFMRSQAYDQLQNLGFGFHDRHSTGQIINRALSDLHNIRFFMNLSLVSAAEIVGYVIGYNFLVAAINPWMGLAALLPVPFWIMYIRHFGRRMQPIQKSIMDTGDQMVSVYSEAVAGVHVVKAFATEQMEVKKYKTKTDLLFDQTMQTVSMWAAFVPTIRGIATAANLLLFFIGGLLAVHGVLFAGDIFVFGIAMGAILSRLQQINQISNQYQTAIVSARRFFEIIYATPTVIDQPGASNLPPGKGCVEFRSVSFGYQPQNPVLRDISFRVEAGSMVALVGPTGAGKTTLMQLLARFYDPQQGSIMIDGADIRQVSLGSLRRSVSVVFQETFLFSDTVANNIRYANPDAPMEMVRRAAQMAQAEEFISQMPDGYDTVLGERGTTLSGGQKQRIAIARAILADPRILILDDALAAIDPGTEALIRRSLRELLRNRTLFVIAHRLSTVKAADQVLVLENGFITQRGTHEHLVAESGHYRDIARIQLLGFDSSLIEKPPAEVSP
jgi:ABC-type multidrug transport system fused ATPase/permease subunit